MAHDFVLYGGGEKGACVGIMGGEIESLLVINIRD